MASPEGGLALRAGAGEGELGRRATSLCLISTVHVCTMPSPQKKKKSFSDFYQMFNT